MVGAHYTEQMAKLAEVGASLCGYMPGAGNPEKWPESRCDCKFLPDMLNILRPEYHELGSFTSEMTGCCEVRQAWRVLDALRVEAKSAPPEPYWIVEYRGKRFRTTHPEAWSRIYNTKIFYGPFLTNED